ncbi:hypothetical protein D6D13_03992 [Aureobasidium pullulans]|uniref:Uncharacterized protein n=1 Tax=Aureobasidium pullulans TaxID=5580 RepID=A0A4S9D207_AURPU|nr:hypothetical protein D6D13_03992 [Aureobasidium pullulans]
MTLPTTANWTARINTVVVLSNNERFFMAEKEARMLLEYPELPQHFRLRSLILFAQSVESCMHLMWPAKTAGSDNNIVMDRLRRFLDELNEDILEDRPENWYNLDGPVQYESAPDEDEGEMSDELEDQEKELEDEEQILKDTKSQQSDDSEFDDSTTNLLFDLENESSKPFTSTNNEGDSISPHFEPQTFLEAHKKVAGDDDSVASAETNKQDESESAPHLRDIYKLFAANKSGAGADRVESQTETIVTNKSSPDTLKIDGNMIEEANVQPDKSTKEKEAEPKNTQEEAAILDDIPSKKRKAADRPSTKVNEIQSVLSSQHKSYIKPSKQDVTTILDDPAPNKRMKND